MSALWPAGEEPALRIGRVNPNATSLVNSRRNSREILETSPTMIFLEEEETESFAPVDGDSLNMFKRNKKRIADKSGA